MDNPKINVQTSTSKNLANALNSYNVLIFCLFIFIGLIILLYIANPNGFSKYFGNEVFITGPILLLLGFLLKELITFQKNPRESFFANIPGHRSEWFPIIIMLFIAFLCIVSFLGILNVAGIFSNEPPANNIAVIINFLIIIIFIIIASLIYSSTKEKDAKILSTMPKTFGDIYQLRSRYTLLFFIFLIFVTFLYFENPMSIMTNYGGASVFFLLFVGLIMVSMITIYQYYLANPSKINFFNTAPTLGLFLKGIYIIFALFLSGLLIYESLSVIGLFEQDASKPESWPHIIFNILLFCGMLGIIYKLANAGGFLDKNPLYRLILYTLLYIPCLLVFIIDFIAQIFGLSKGEALGFSPPTKSEITTLLIILVLFVIYFGSTMFVIPYIKNKYYKKGGNQLVNEPIQTNKLTNVATYQTLTGSDKFSYQYAISFWFYIDSFGPSTNSSYLKVVPLLSYGENPCIKYSSPNNTIYITVKQKVDDKNVVDYVQSKEIEIKKENIDEWKSIQKDISEKIKTLPIGEEMDSEGHRLIYKHPDVLLQKWNNIVINYNGGTLDVFYNGKLVKSAIEVVPYMKYDMLTVGTENGINGSIANLIYFNKPLDYFTINTLYSSLKNKNPPSIS